MKSKLRKLIREQIKETLKESKQVGILYHWTDLEHLAKILQTNTLQAGHTGGGEREYISTTRSKDKSQFDIAKNADVSLVLNGDKISNNHKITPYHDEDMEEYGSDDIMWGDFGPIGIAADDWDDDDWDGKKPIKIKRYGKFDEMEELITGNLHPLNKYLIKVILYKTNPKIENILKSKNIPYELK